MGTEIHFLSCGNKLRTRAASLPPSAYRSTMQRSTTQVCMGLGKNHGWMAWPLSSVVSHAPVEQHCSRAQWQTRLYLLLTQAVIVAAVMLCLAGPAHAIRTLHAEPTALTAKAATASSSTTAYRITKCHGIPCVVRISRDWSASVLFRCSLCLYKAM